MKKKLFVTLLAVVACLVSGCTLPPQEGHPPANHIVHFVNETPFRVRIIKDGFTVQRCLLPEQSQVLSMTVSSDARIEKAYRLVAYRTDENTVKETVVATENFVMRIRGVDYNSVVSRIFVIKYEWGTNLIVEESGRGLFGF